MNELVQELLWWFFSRIIAPLLLLFIFVNIWQNYQEITPHESTEPRETPPEQPTNEPTAQEKVLLKQFATEYFTALRTQDAEKILQLFRDNPNTANEFQQMLLTLPRFGIEFFTALQTQNAEKIGQMLIDNPNKAALFQEMLTRYGEDELAELVGKLRQALSDDGSSFALYFSLYRLQEEGEKAYDAANYSTAMEKWEQGLKKARELGDKRYISGFIGGIGVVYRTFGQYHKALAYSQQALAISREIQDRHQEGADLGHIGNVYQNLGQYQKALAYYQQSLEIQREIQNRRGEGNNLGNIGNVYDYLGQHQKALAYYQQALAIHHELKDRHGEGAGLTNIGVVYKRLGKYQKAKKAFQDSASILENLLGSGNLWMAQRGLASAEAKLTQFKAAIKHYEQALDNLEKLRAGITEKEHKTSFMQDKLYVYDEQVTILQSLHQTQPEKGYDRKALETFERKQGRIFLEEMGQSGARRFADLDNDIMQAEQELAQKWQQLSNQPLSSPERAAFEQKLEQKQATLEQQLKTQYPKYYALKYPQPAKLATLQNKVLQKGEMVLVYGVLPAKKDRESTTILWVIGKHQFQMLTLDISEEQLQAKVDAFRAGPNMLIKAIKTEPYWDIPDLAEDNLPSQRQASYDLYQQLLPAAAKTLLKDARTLYIVPTGPLYGLPFGALETHNPDEHDEPHYLIQDYPIAYLSSASLLKTIRETERKASDRQPFLAFADPEYPATCATKSADATDFIQTKRTEAYLKLAGSGENGCFTKGDELADTKKQAEAIAKLLQVSTDSDALQLRAKASRSNVFYFSEKKRLDDYQYVLFAAHAVLPNEITRINQSAIVLSNPDTEGYLTMADAFALDMNADLVLLSACNTGRGENIKGEGVRGLTRAFMYAGTPAVSVSLWSVESKSAKALSISLFKYLQAGKPLAQALRQSKLDLMADEDFEMYQHPYFWAPFVVFGDGGRTTD